MVQIGLCDVENIVVTSYVVWNPSYRQHVVRIPCLYYAGRSRQVKLPLEVFCFQQQWMMMKMNEKTSEEEDCLTLHCIALDH